MACSTASNNSNEKKNVVCDNFLALGHDFGISRRRVEREFRSLYGMPSAAAQYLFNEIKTKTTVAMHYSYIDFFMGLNFLCCPPVSWEDFGSKWRKDPRTCEKYIGTTMAAITHALPPVSDTHSTIITSL